MPGTTDNFLIAESGSTQVASKYWAAGLDVGVGHVEVVHVAGLSGDFLDTDGSNNLMVSVQNAPNVKQVRPSTAARTVVAAAAADTQLMAANAARLDSMIYNDSSSQLYIGYGSAAVTTSDFTYLLAAFGLFEVPYGYTGEVRGRWVTATGQARITTFS